MGWFIGGTTFIALFRKKIGEVIDQDDNVEGKYTDKNYFVRSMGDPMFVKILVEMMAIWINRNNLCNLTEDWLE